MKKFICMMLVLTMVLSAATVLADAVAADSYLSVPSKTTSHITQTVHAQAVSGVELPEDFNVSIIEDAEQVVKEIIKLFTFVNTPVEETTPEGEKIERNPAPIEYFAEEVRAKVEEGFAKQFLLEDPEWKPEEFDSKTLEIYEFFTVDEMNYDDEYGDVVARFEFATQYIPSQKVLAMLAFYTGELDEEGNDIVEWETAPARVVEHEDDDEAAQVIEQNAADAQTSGTELLPKSHIDVTLTKDQMTRMRDSEFPTAMAIVSEPIPVEEVEQVNPGQQ